MSRSTLHKLNYLLVVYTRSDMRSDTMSDIKLIICQMSKCQTPGLLRRLTKKFDIMRLRYNEVNFEVKFFLFPNLLLIQSVWYFDIWQIIRNSDMSCHMHPLPPSSLISVEYWMCESFLVGDTDCLQGITLVARYWVTSVQAQ